MNTMHFDVDEHVPLPTDDRAPYATIRERAEAACKAAEMLVGLGMDPGVPDEVAAATVLLTAAAGKKVVEKDMRAAMAAPASAVHLRNLLSQYDQRVIEDAVQLRNYITNRLISESDNPDPRIRIRALELLGKITDVALFTERSEVTVSTKSTNELEDTLRKKLNKIRYGGEVVDATPAPVLTPPDVSSVLFKEPEDA